MCKISIIIPVYKVEKYIRRCLDSVINQTYQNIEIVLVDDGSPDKSGNICDEYAIRDKRIKVIHKSNSGVTEARILGLQNCSGDYVAFIDSDDYISRNYIEYLYDCIVRYHVSIACCQDITVLANGKKQLDVRSEFGVFDEKRLKTLLANNYLYDFRIKKGASFFLGLWGKLFDKKLLNGNVMKVAKGLYYGEDCVTLLYIMYKLPSLYVSDKYLYFYVQHAEQATKRFDSEAWNNWIKHLYKIIEIDSEKYFRNQLPYRVLYYFKQYIKYNVVYGSPKDFKSRIELSLQHDIVKDMIINHNFKILPICDKFLIMLIKHKCYLYIYYIIKLLIVILN